MRTSENIPELVGRRGVMELCTVRAVQPTYWRDGLTQKLGRHRSSARLGVSKVVPITNRYTADVAVP